MCDSTFQTDVVFNANRILRVLFFDLWQSKSDQSALSLPPLNKAGAAPQILVLLTEVPWLWFPLEVFYYLNSEPEPMAMFVCVCVFLPYGLI